MFLTAPYVYELAFACCSGGPVEAVEPGKPLPLPGDARPCARVQWRVWRDHRMWLQFGCPLAWYVTEI